MTQRKCICFFTHYSSRSKVGGAEVKSLYFANALAERGWKVIYLARDSASRSVEQSVEGLITFYHIPRKLYLTYLFDYTFFEIVRKERVKFFYFRNDSPYNFLAWLYTRMFGGTYVHANTSDLYMRPFRFTRLSWNERGKNPIKTALLLFEHLLMDLLLNFCLRHSDRTIVETNAQYSAFLKQFAIRSAIIKGSHPPASPPTAPKADPPMALWVANAKPLKRPELFIQLAQQLQDLNSKFVLVAGKTSADFLTQLLSMAKGITNLTILREVSLDDVNRLFEEAHVFVNTSEYESIGNTYIQAWFRKTPVVTLSCDPDGIIERYNLGFHSRTFDRLGRDVRTLLTDAELRSSIGDRALIYALEHHDLNKSAASLESLLLELDRSSS